MKRRGELPPGRSRRGRWAWAAILAATVLVGVLPGTALAWDAASFSSADESLMVSLTNQRRAASSLPPLIVDATLRSVARARSKDMGDRGSFSHHIPPDGHTAFDELRGRGYCFRTAAENYAWNTYPDSQATRAAQGALEASASHRANILGSRYTRIGVGAYEARDGKHVWTVLFTEPCGASAQQPAARPPAAQPRPATPRPAAPPRPTPAPDPTAAPALAVTEVAPAPTTAVDGATAQEETGQPARRSIADSLGRLLDRLLAVVVALARLFGAPPAV